MPETLGHLWEGGVGQRHLSAMDTSLTTQDHGQECPQIQDHSQDSCPCISRIMEHTSGSRTMAKSFRLTTMGSSSHCRTMGPSRGFWRLLGRLDRKQPPLWLRTWENHQGRTTGAQNEGEPRGHHGQHLLSSSATARSRQGSGPAHGQLRAGSGPWGCPLRCFCAFSCLLFKRDVLFDHIFAVFTCLYTFY